jgi:proteasome accessory factor C
VSATSDVARMLTLVPWLLERPGASLQEVAETFAVDVDTVRDDLAHLDFCGLPGLGGGDLFEVSTVADRVVVRMADELKRPLRPTPSEALRLVLTVDAVAEVLGDEVPALRSAVTKVRAALGVSEQTADVVEPTGPAVLGELRRAVTDGRRVSLTYQGRADDRPADRSVDPWALHVVDGSWYLQGWDHGAGDRRVFRADRVVGIEVTDDPVEVPAPAELEPPRYVPGPDDLEVVLEVDAGGRWLQDAVTVDEVEDLDGGGARRVCRTDAPGWVARLVLMAGGQARVVAPEAVARPVRELAQRALDAYTPTD